MTPTALIRSYWGEVWNERRPELIAELCRDPIVRHDPSCVSELSVAEQIARVRQQSEELHPRFTHEVLLGDDRFVCSVWNMTTCAGERVDLSGVEVFEAADGRFTDCWNTPYSKGFWARAAGGSDIFVPRVAVGGTGVAGDPAGLVRAFFDALVKADAAALEAMLGAGAMLYRTGEAASVTAAEVLADPLAGGQGAITFDALFAQGDLACAVWNLAPAEGMVASGIDVFRVASGRIVEWWSPPRTRGAWGREGDAAVVADLPPPALLGATAEIDHHWLQAVFHHAGVELPRISMVRATPLGHGNVSDTVRVAMNYNKPVVDEPTSVVCKFHSPHADVGPLVAAIAPYRAEVEAYRLFGATPPIRTARAYFAECSDDGTVANLVLEDLGAVCEAGDQVAGCSVGDAAAVTRELARMHAHFWNAPGLKQWPWIVANRPQAAALPDFYAMGVAVFEERYAAELGEADMAVIRAFAPLNAAWRAREPEAITLIHADPRVDNIMFDRRGDETHAYLIDWQMVSRGSPAIDLAYFLTGSLSIADRRACERALIAGHARVVAAVDPAYTPERAEREYRLAVASGLNATIGAAAVMPDTPHNRALLLALARRNVAAVRDWNSLDAIGAG